MKVSVEAVEFHDNESTNLMADAMKSENWGRHRKKLLVVNCFLVFFEMFFFEKNSETVGCFFRS